MAIIEYIFKNMSSNGVEEIEESVASHVGKENVSVIALNDFDHCMTITVSDEPYAIFHIGKVIGHYNVCINHGLIIPRKVRIYGDKYKKTYPLAVSTQK